MITKFLMLISSTLAVFHSRNWWWVFGVVLVLDRVEHWLHFHSRPWRKIHYPAMTRHAFLLGVANSMHPNDPNIAKAKAIFALVKHFHPSLTDGQAGSLIQDLIHRCDSFADEPILTQEFRRRSQNLTEIQIQDLIETIRKEFNASNPYMFVRFVIAELIAIRFGAAHRTEYLIEVCRGSAN